MVNLDALTYAGNPDTLASVSDNPDHVFVQGRIGDRELVDRLLATVSSLGRRQLRRRDARRPLHRRSEGLCTDQRGRDPRTPRGRALLLERPRRGGPRRLPLSARLHGRGVRDAGARRLLYRGEPLQAQLPLRRLQGGLRPSRAGLPSHLRAPHAHDQLLEQLRSLPLSREAHTAHDPDRHARRTPARLRRRAAHQGLALRRGPLQGYRRCAPGAAVPGRRTTSAATTSGRTSRSSRPSARCSTRLVPGSPHESLITFVADRPGHDRRYAIDAGKIERELGWRPEETLETGLEKTVRWYLENRGWCEAALSRGYRGERLGSRGGPV